MAQYFAGTVIALMLTGGQVLESVAGTRARRELSALVERVPRSVHRYLDGGVEVVPLAEVRVGDRLLIKPGEVLPVDGLVAAEHPGQSVVLDESALTGEARPIEHPGGDRVASGVVNAGGPFDLRATATAEASTYAGIIRLVEEAQAEKAPLVRLADRYSLIFLPVTLAMAGLAWLLSGDPVRGLAVMVVATPCPLILAAPIAIVSGISRAARKGIIIKGGGALETLARGHTLLVDKTGTVTAGEPKLEEVHLFSEVDEREALCLAATLDQMSPHLLATAIVHAARRRGIDLGFPRSVHEETGSGIEGLVGEHRVRLGKMRWVGEAVALPPNALALRQRSLSEGSSLVFVAVDERLVAALRLSDPIRDDAAQTIEALRATGFSEVTLVTGDHSAFAERVGQAVGADRVLADQEPADKVEAVKSASVSGPVVMVGDGINDAPALAAAAVGVAMGARGATASSEAADIVLVVDRLDRLVKATQIAQRSRHIALQSIGVGMALSLVAMLFAGLGYLPPVAGALLQEGIDVAVILNALRALGGGRRPRRALA